MASPPADLPRHPASDGWHAWPTEADGRREFRPHAMSVAITSGAVCRAYRGATRWALTQCHQQGPERAQSVETGDGIRLIVRLQSHLPRDGRW